eukprot:scaffold5305_cov107-Isochrysis_galbana.AAC.1
MKACIAGERELGAVPVDPVVDLLPVAGLREQHRNPAGLQPARVSQPVVLGHASRPCSLDGNRQLKYRRLERFRPEPHLLARRGRVSPGSLGQGGSRWGVPAPAPGELRHDGEAQRLDRRHRPAVQAVLALPRFELSHVCVVEQQAGALPVGLRLGLGRDPPPFIRNGRAGIMHRLGERAYLGLDALKLDQRFLRALGLRRRIGGRHALSEPLASRRRRDGSTARGVGRGLGQVKQRSQLKARELGGIEIASRQPHVLWWQAPQHGAEARALGQSQWFAVPLYFREPLRPWAACCCLKVCRRLHPRRSLWRHPSRLLMQSLL